MCPNTACGVQVRKTDMAFGSLFTIKQYSHNNYLVKLKPVL